MLHQASLGFFGGWEAVPVCVALLVVSSVGVAVPGFCSAAMLAAVVAGPDFWVVSSAAAFIVFSGGTCGGSVGMSLKSLLRVPLDTCATSFWIFSCGSVEVGGA